MTDAEMEEYLKKIIANKGKENARKRLDKNNNNLYTEEG
jgi:hypothetical protein